MYALWYQAASQSSGHIVADLKMCLENALDRRRVVKDTNDDWYALGAKTPSAGESTSQNSFCTSTVFEEGQVEYVPVNAPNGSVPGPTKNVYLRERGSKGSPGVQ